MSEGNQFGWCAMSEVNNVVWQNMVRHGKLAVVWLACPTNRTPIRSPVKAAPSAYTVHYRLQLASVCCSVYCPLSLFCFHFKMTVYFAQRYQNHASLYVLGVICSLRLHKVMYVHSFEQTPKTLSGGSQLVLISHSWVSQPLCEWLKQLIFSKEIHKKLPILSFTNLFSTSTYYYQ